MLQSISAIQEIQFLLYLTAIFLGFELAIYFLYRYYKIRDEQLPLNRILLSFGMFYSFFISGSFLLAVNKFIVNSQILYKLGYIFLLVSPVVFLFFITLKEFSKIINLKIARFLMILGLIPIIIVLFLPIASIYIFLLVVSLTLLNSLYIIIFQIKLMRTLKSNIKRRLIQIFIGDVLSIISLLFVLEITTSFYSSDMKIILFFLGITMLIAGIIIVTLGVYSFPALYELKWEENLLQLFIINQKNYECLYSHNFSEIKYEQNQADYEKLLSAGVTGIDNIISAITNTQGEKINKIKQADSLFLLEYGTEISSEITFVLVVKKDLNSNSYFLKSIKDQFEGFYKEILHGLDSLKGSEEALFKSFDIIIKNMML